MKHNRIITNSFRTIKNSFARFLSLLIISMLGVFTFSGLQATNPDMINTLDAYLDNQNVYDIEIVSTLGLTDDDVSALKQVNGIKEVEASYSKDVILTEKDNEYVINISQLPTNINKIIVKSGKLPEKDNEIVFEENFLKHNNLKIGDIISINDEKIKNNKFTISGTIESPLHYNSVDMSQSRGRTNIGSGTIDYIAYINSSNFKQDYYNYLYVTIDKAKELTTSNNDYIELIDKSISEIETIKSTQENQRYDSIYNEALDEIQKNEDKANKELSENKNKLDKYNNELKKAKKKLDAYNNELKRYETELSKNKKELQKNKDTLNSKLKESDLSINNIDKTITELTTAINNIQSSLSLIPTNSEQYFTYQQQLSNYQEKLNSLKILKETSTKLEQYEKTLASEEKKLLSSRAEYQKNLNSYKTNYQKYLNNLSTYNKSKKNVEKKFKELKENLNEIKHPTWHINDRTSYTTYLEYIDDSNSISNLSQIFPLVFYAVAVLVSLISMNRMVEDDRLELGTLKSLGFNNFQILTKYIIFSFLATIIGSLIGAVLGVIIIPTLIFNIYGLLFSLPSIKLSLNLKMTLISIIISIICICGTTILTVNKELKEKTSTLMRPKSPKDGKRILLEKITFIWNKLKFSNKITIRNLFRYKKRVIVTIIGITGCTALMLCGFGIKDAIVDISKMQYKETYTYDLFTYNNELSSEEEKEIFNNENITDYIHASLISATSKKTEVNVIVADNSKSLSTIVNLKDTTTKKNIDLKDNEVIITDKLADILKLKVGDSINFTDQDNNDYSFKISNIVHNYVGHYIYMDKQTYERTSLEYKPNVTYIKTKNISEEEKKELMKNILSNDQIINVIEIDTLIKQITDMLDSLDKVVAILIILAASLAFVVLYNLSNININERKREIATLKVLGFYNNEVDKYITKETIILTFIGIALGLIGGYYLTNIVITTVEIERARFIHHITLKSYLYASCLSSIFTIIVNVVTHFILKKIDMIESLKSIE